MNKGSFSKLDKVQFKKDFKDYYLVLRQHADKVFMYNSNRWFNSNDLEKVGKDEDIYIDGPPAGYRETA